MRRCHLLILGLVLALAGCGAAGSPAETEPSATSAPPAVAPSAYPAEVAPPPLPSAYPAPTAAP